MSFADMGIYSDDTAVDPNAYGDADLIPAPGPNVEGLPTEWRLSEKQDPTVHHGFFATNPYGARTRPEPTFLETVLSIAIFRCWHIVLFFFIWSTGVTLLQRYDDLEFSVPDALLKIVGASLGFITAFRASSSFERYDQGRAMWADIVRSSRAIAANIWFNVSDNLKEPGMSPEEQKARCVLEKKTAINLVEAFAVALKHYLRGEDGIYYSDLYHLVNYLPAYALPAGIVTGSQADQSLMMGYEDEDERTLAGDNSDEKEKDVDVERGEGRGINSSRPVVLGPSSQFPTLSRHQEAQDSREKLSKADEIYLLPGYNPQGNARQVFDFFPFNVIIEAYKAWRKKVVPPSEHKMAKMRARMMNAQSSKNLPLEISLYLGSYIAALQRRKTNDNATISQLYAGLNQLVDSLSQLERILTTPLPWSFRIHFWVTLTGWNLLLPFQIVDAMGWYTIPGCTVLAAMFYGFLVSGEELENPFRYTKNSLNLDHFTKAIIPGELRAITSTAPPNPSDWVFERANNVAFSTQFKGAERVTPEEWVRRGPIEMQTAMRELAGQ